MQLKIESSVQDKHSSMELHYFMKIIQESFHPFQILHFITVKL